jgi:hypothetical protein
MIRAAVKRLHRRAKKFFFVKCLRDNILPATKKNSVARAVGARRFGFYDSRGYALACKS